MKENIAKGLADLKAQGLTQMNDHKLIEDMDVDAWKFEPASPGQIRFVYVVGKAAGYLSDEVHGFGHHHMNKGEITELIKQLKDEAGWIDD